MPLKITYIGVHLSNFDFHDEIISKMKHKYGI